MFVTLLCALDAKDRGKKDSESWPDDAELVANYARFYTFCFCSPLLRAHETLWAAKRIYIREPVRVLPALREVRGFAPADLLEDEEYTRREYDSEVQTRIRDVHRILDEIKKLESAEENRAGILVLLVSHPDFIWHLTSQDGRVGHLLAPGEMLVWKEM